MTFHLNYYYSLPDHIITHIESFIPDCYVNYIIYSWKRYKLYNSFIKYMIINLKYYKQYFTNNFKYQTFNITSDFVTFYFKKLYNILIKLKKYNINIPFIYNTIFMIYATSIKYYEDNYNFDHPNYSINKFYCINISQRLQWNDIQNIFQYD